MVLLEFGLNSFEENIKKDSAIALFWATNSVLAHDGSSHRFNASGPCNSETGSKVLFSFATFAVIKELS